ncbi:MAG: acyl--CoA ligase [Chloroflexi bacterium]|nr:acyl--CoA ligase [Chloroflexota bacterium]
MGENETQYKDIHTILSEMAERHPNKVYIESLDQGKSITFKQTHRLCNKIANYLRAQNIKASDNIVLIGENSIETLLIFFGVLNYGAAIGGINVEESKENIYRLLHLAKPRIVFYSQELLFDQERYEGALWIPYANLDVEGGEENELFSILKDYSFEFDSPVGTKDDVATLVFTSGTTAVPKAVAATREYIFYSSLDIIDRFKVTERDVILDYRAYSWASPQVLSIIPSLMTGATLVFGKKFSHSRFTSWLKDYGITICVGVPAVFNMLLEEDIPLHKRDVPSLRFMTSSTAPLLVRNLLRFEEKYGILINQLAGSSETGWMAVNDPETLNQPEKRKIGSIGKVPRYKELFILDEQGKKLGPGEEGEIVVTGKSRALGYLQEDGTINKFPEEGFLTGDLGYIDDDDYVYITGRKKDLIIRGGVNISPMEITRWIMEHPAVQEVATIGVPDEVRGEDVASFVVLKEGEQISVEDIIEHCRKKLPDWKLPKTLYFLKEIPKNERDKLSKPGLLKIWEENR